MSYNFDYDEWRARCVQDELRRAERQRNKVPDEVIQQHAKRASQIWPVLAAFPHFFVNVPVRELAAAALYHDGMIRREIGECLGVCASRIQQMNAKFQRRLNHKHNRRRAAMVILPDVPPSDPDAADFGWQSWTPEQQHQEFAS